MTTPSQTPTHVPSLCQAIANQDHGLSLKILQQLPLRNRWETVFLLNRTFNKRSSKDYLRALTHDLLYRALREESVGNTDEASRLYRLLIQHNSGRKITQKAREGFKRIAAGNPRIEPAAGNPRIEPAAENPRIEPAAGNPRIETAAGKPPIESTPDEASPQTAINTPRAETLPVPAISQPATITDDEISFVLLKPVQSNQKKALAIKLANILDIDPYTARLTLPSIECRILRYGLAATLDPLHQALMNAGVMSSHISVSSIQAVNVYEVLYIEAVDEQLVVQVRDPDQPGQSQQMTFKWTDIQQSVEGLLPLFEDVIDVTAQHKITHKTTTQDHAQIMDLHLQNNHGILRFYDAGYQFNQGLSLVSMDNPRAILDTKTSWAQWRGLKQLINQHLPSVPEHHKFDHFASHVVEQIELLTKIDAHIHILRRHECYWDQVFHLYSALHYVQSPETRPLTS